MDLKFRNAEISSVDKKSEKEAKDLEVARADSVSRWLLWGYRIDFILRYVFLVGLIIFIISQIVYIHHVISFQEHANHVHRLSAGAFDSIVHTGLGGAILLSLLVGYWFGKNNSFIEYAKIVFERFKK